MMRNLENGLKLGKLQMMVSRIRGTIVVHSIIIYALIGFDVDDLNFEDITECYPETPSLDADNLDGMYTYHQ